MGAADIIGRSHMVNRRDNSERSTERRRGELVSLKPGLWGITVDLKELFRRLGAWWHGRINTQNRPQRPLRFVTDDHDTTWSPAELGCHLHGRWRVTNLFEREVFILKARIEGYETAFGHVATQAPDGLFGPYSILPNQMSEIIADFPFFPTILSGPNPFVADVIFTDNLEVEHRVSAVRFAYRGP
jgi:hypothetical protein